MGKLSPGGPRRGSRRSLKIAIAVAFMAIAVPTVAWAQLPDDPTAPVDRVVEDPFAAGEQAAADAGAPDTDVTPVAKENGERWVRVQGAVYPEDHVPDDSVTDFRDSLLDVSFLNETRGYAGGSRQIDCDGTLTDVPVMYSYAERGGTGVQWRLDFVGDCDDPGFIGSIAWLGGSGEAVAVGGDGSYPYRELPYRESCQEGERDPVTGVFTVTNAYGVKCDPAGKARAWQTTDGAWDEITEDLPRDSDGDEVRGMTALDLSPVGRFGYAGGLGQLLRWQENGFDKVFDTHTPCPRDPVTVDPGGTGPIDPDPVDTGVEYSTGQACEFTQADRFRFRVREIRINPSATYPSVFAVTDGCCAEDSAHNTPILLAYAGGAARWYPAVLDPFSSFLVDEGAPVNPGAVNTGPGRLNVRQEMPDSFYSLTVNAPSGGSVRVAVVASPGGPEGTTPERSVVTQPYCTWDYGRHNSPIWYGDEQATVPDQFHELLHSKLSSVRLVSGDGDTASSFGQNAGQSPTAPGVFGGPTEASTGVLAGNCSMRNARELPDGVPDWVVGEQRSTKTAQGSRGVALSTVLRPSLLPETVQAEVDVAKLLAGQLPTDDRKLAAYLSSLLLELDSYSLNSVEVLPSGEAWAVGEHGGIVHDGGINPGGAEPEPPRFGSRPPAGISAGGEQGVSLPPAGRPGPVPALATRPRLDLDRAQVFSAGSPYPANDGLQDPIEDVRQLVMSRDGSEGWAIGASDMAGQTFRLPMLSLAHFDGESWVRCDPVGVEGQVDPDPACRALAPLRSYVDLNKRTNPVRLLAAARVPLEYDDDPTNDDEFKILAGTIPYRLAPGDQEAPGLVTYEDGRWRPEPYGEFNELIGSGSMEPRTIAFTAPDDGWVLAGTNTNPPTAKLLHFDGEHWSNCTPGGPAGSGCGDPGCPSAGPPGLLCFRPADGSRDVVRGMVSSGRDLFLYGSRELNGERYPFVIHRNGDGPWSADPEAGGLDPVGAVRQGGPTPTAEQRGEVQSLALAPSADGGMQGWAVGSFSTRPINAPRVSTSSTGVSVDFSAGGQQGQLTARTALLRFESAAWQPFIDSGPVMDYLRARPGSQGACFQSSQKGAARQCDPTLPDTSSNLQVTLPDGDGGLSAVVAQRDSGRLFGFDADRGRWEIVDQPRSPATGPSSALGNRDGWLDGPMQAVAPDGDGGVWLVSGDPNSNFPHSNFHHLTDHPPAPVFREAPSPLRDGESFTSLAGSPDGTVWATTRSGVVLRYDRVLGWDRVSVPGWDPGRIVTRPSRALAVASGPGGEGLAVGERGRIAELSPDAVRLDRATGTSCALRSSDEPPCSTGFDLLSAAIAADGSGAAMAGGMRMTLLWRPGGEEFRAINPPPGNPFDSITGVALPHPGEAYVATNSGQIFRGTGGAGGWSWLRENLNPRTDVPQSLRRDIISLNGRRLPIPLRAIGVDANGHGYAVGDDGLTLERVGDGEHAWRRLRTPFADDLTSVGLSPGGAGGALLGGRNGLILTADGPNVRVARPADHFHGWAGAQSGSVVGIATVPGDADGETEAWAATAGLDPGRSIGKVGSDYNNAVSQLFHFSSDSEDPWLDPTIRAEPLPDAPTRRAGELSFAAMGRASCRAAPDSDPCLDMNGAAQDFEVATKRAVTEIAERAENPDGPAFTLFTGDAVDTAGTPGSQETERQLDYDANGLPLSPIAYDHESFNGPRKLRRFREAVVDALDFAGVPLFAAPGVQDLSSVSACRFACEVTTRRTAGDNLSWRQTFAEEPGPWGTGVPVQATSPAAEGLSFDDAPASTDAVRHQDQNLADPDQDLPNGDGPLTASKVGTGGASTHYALDISRGGDKVARVVVADTATGSLQVSDPLQQPLEPKGQLLWIDRMTCIAGGSATDGTPCTREPEQQAIVLTTTPTYSYGPGGLSDTNTADGVQLEQVLMQNRVNVVVSGRLGWNGLYYATAPGLHTPCAGDPYPSGPPTSSVPCGAGAGGAVGQFLPFVVASDVAGSFGPDGSQSGSASQGYWHGYSIVRLDPSGDPAKTVVEQRPVLDWISIQPRSVSGDTHTIRAGRKLALIGMGREPVSASTEVDRQQTTRYDEISTPAITHRFDLVEADPERPWVPREAPDNGVENAASMRIGEEDPCGPYLCLDPKVATINDQSGEIRAGKGNYPRTFAIAALSVGKLSATYPLVFEPRASFKPPTPPPVRPPALPTPPSNPTAPPEPTPPVVDALVPPVLPTLTAAAPPAPPVPPTPPPAEPQTPLDLNLAPSALDVNPPTAVSQPPTPPVNPAPPSGARREARQRQAAAQKSGADNAEEGSEVQELGGDPVDSGPDRASMTRNDFTALAHREQPSAWARDALLGGGIGLAALILAFGLRTARPTPRRREPELPAPAWGRQRGRR